jgi:two-component system NtrC family response regulator
MAKHKQPPRNEWVKVAKKTLKQIEEETIKKALHRNGWNITHTAAELGINRATLYRKMWRLGLY